MSKSCDLSTTIAAVSEGSGLAEYLSIPVVSFLSELAWRGDGSGKDNRGKDGHLAGKPTWARPVAVDFSRAVFFLAAPQSKEEAKVLDLVSVGIIKWECEVQR